MRLYIKLLTYEEQISSAQMENLGVSDNEEGVAPEDFYRDDTETGASVANTGVSTLEIAEMKAQKAIDKHSMMFKEAKKKTKLF